MYILFFQIMMAMSMTTKLNNQFEYVGTYWLGTVPIYAGSLSLVVSSIGLKLTFDPPLPLDDPPLEEPLDDDPLEDDPPLEDEPEEPLEPLEDDPLDDDPLLDPLDPLLDPLEPLLDPLDPLDDEPPDDGVGYLQTVYDIKIYLLLNIN